MSIESILESLTPGEKVAAMNYLWLLLSANQADFVSPAWHGDILSDRSRHLSDKPRLSNDDAMADVRERINARRTEG